MPAMIVTDPPIFGLSILIAVVASSAALWLAFQLRSERVAPRVWLALKIGSALIMGVAITGMHDTGMLAAHFMPIAGAATEAGIQPLPLGAAIGIATVGDPGPRADIIAGRSALRGDQAPPGG